MSSQRVVFLTIAPPAPPCFSSRDSWVTYLDGAQRDARDGHRKGPLLTEDPPRFDYQFTFCVGCTAQHSFAMQRQGKCCPDAVRVLDPAREAA